MSIVQEAYKKIRVNLNKWNSLSNTERQTTLHMAYSLMGEKFLKAIMIVENPPPKFRINEYQSFVFVQIQNTKQVLFFQGRTVHCSCKDHWNRCTLGNSSLMCMHWIVYQLSTKVFQSSTAKYRQPPTKKQLAELLTLI